MRRFAWRWLVVSSLPLIAVLAGAETRPQYGGTLRVAMHETFTSVDPAQTAQPESPMQANLLGLVFETLVTVDEHGNAQPGLAISWQASHNNRRWSLRLRPGVKFHDGTVLTADLAAAALRAANPSWQIAVDNDLIIVDREKPGSAMLSELALPRNAITHREHDGILVGTGPFRIEQSQTGQHLTLAANDDYWDGRPFLDTIEVEVGKSVRDQLTEFQSGKLDLIEIAPEQAQRAPIDHSAIRSSLPMELLALVFTRDTQSPDERLLRQAVALSIDRNSIGTVLLQGTGQPAGGLLPNWMTGYAFVFSTEADLSQARRLRNQAQSVPSWTLGYNTSDSLSRLIAERIALNARDVGLSVQPVTNVNPDLRLIRFPLTSADPPTALENLAAFAGLTVPEMQNNSIEEVYAAEQSLLAAERIVPLFHLPIIYAVSPVVKNWKLARDGSWNLPDVWLDNKQ